MTAEELITKIVLGTVTDADCQAFTPTFQVLCNLLTSSRKILEDFGYHVSSKGTMFGPSKYSYFRYNMILDDHTNGYKLTIHGSNRSYYE